MSEMGMLTIDRGIFTDPNFTAERFSQREAFLWLIADSKNSGMPVRVSRCRRDLAHNWGWHMSRVSKFLKKMEKLGKIKIVHDEDRGSARSEWGDDSQINLYRTFLLSKSDRFVRSQIPRSIIEAVFARDGKRCVYCGSTEGPFELDHVLPWSRGGENTADNLVVSCRVCNRWKSDRTPEEMGWKL